MISCGPLRLRYIEFPLYDLYCTDGRHSYCRGDKGGLLTCAGNGTAGHVGRYLCDIVSRGIGCAALRGSHYPGYYMDVRKYSYWIEKLMRTCERHHWSKAL